MEGSRLLPLANIARRHEKRRPLRGSGAAPPRSKGLRFSGGPATVRIAEIDLTEVASVASRFSSCCPGFRGQSYGAVLAPGQRCFYTAREILLSFAGERRQITRSRTGAAHERAPVVIKVLEACCDFKRFDSGARKARLSERSFQPGRGADREAPTLIVLTSSRVELDCGVPEPAKKLHARGIIPDARSDHGVVGRECPHCTEGRYWIWNEVQDERGSHDIVASRPWRQLIRTRGEELNPVIWKRGTRVRDKLLGRVRRHHGSGSPNLEYP